LQNLYNFFIRVLFSSFIKFGIIVSITYAIELFIYSQLLKIYSIFFSNIIASTLGVSMDYLISTSKRINIFSFEKSKKIKLYFIYLIYISTLVIALSWMIEIINIYINNAIVSKLLVIPLGFILNFLFFFLLQKKHKI
jgi:hypothetical protein